MKNIRYVSKDEIYNYVLNLWSTDLFKDLHRKEGSFINLLVKELAQKGFYDFEYSNPVENKHMFLWFYGIGKREYSNPYIKDLYYVHEFYHLISFPHKQFTDFEEWKEAMWQNELEASLMSEVFIYYFIPELRSHTFNHPIWFDDVSRMFGYERIEINKDILHFKKQPEVFNLITQRRMDLRNGIDTTLETEQWIQKFNNKDDWYIHWLPYFKQAEEIRHIYEKDMKEQNNQADNNMRRNLATYSTDNIPFYEVALSTSKVWG